MVSAVINLDNFPDLTSKINVKLRGEKTLPSELRDASLCLVWSDPSWWLTNAFWEKGQLWVDVGFCSNLTWKGSWFLFIRRTCTYNEGFATTARRLVFFSTDTLSSPGHASIWAPPWPSLIAGSFHGSQFSIWINSLLTVWQVGLSALTLLTSLSAKSS